jgi:hypothetical protein
VTGSTFQGVDVGSHRTAYGKKSEELERLEIDGKRKYNR